MPLLCRFVSGFQKLKKVICYYVLQLEMLKFAFQICNVITFTCVFFLHCTAKNKDIALKFCMRVVCILITYIPVLGQNENFGFHWQLFLKRNDIFNFWRQNRKYQKSEITIL